MSATRTTGPTSFFPQDHKFTLVFYTNSDSNFKHLFSYKLPMPFFRKTMQQLTENNLLLVT